MALLPTAAWWGLGVAAAGTLMLVFGKRTAPPAWQSGDAGRPLLRGLAVANPMLGTDPAPDREYTWDTRGQKYADPMVNLRGAVDHGVTYGISPGREYLRAVAPIGSARISTMLGKVNGPAGTQDVKGIAALRDLGAQLGAVAAKEQEKARLEGNDRITAVGARLGPYGVAAAKAWGALSDLVAPLLGKTGSAAKYAALVDGASSEIMRFSNEAELAALPYVWHLFSYLPPEGMGSDDTLHRVQFLSRTARDNIDRLKRLPAHRRAAVQTFWLLLLERMAADPFVERVFRAMHAGDWGGMGNYASDEQVMLVAAAVASKLGLDFHAFASALWDKNGGWSDPKYRGMLRNAEYLAPSDAGGGTGGPPDWPSNATEVQWAGLMETALEIAKTFPRKATLSGAVSSSASTKGLRPPPRPLPWVRRS